MGDFEALLQDKAVSQLVLMKTLKILLVVVFHKKFWNQLWVF